MTIEDQKLNRQIKDFAQDIEDIQDDIQSIKENSNELNYSISRVNKRVSEWQKGVEQVSRQIGNIKSDVIDYAAQLVRIKQSYKQLGKTGKQWLSSVNYSQIYEKATKALTQHKGLFHSAFREVNKTMINMAKNASKMGTYGFADVTQELKSIDYQLLDIQKTIKSMQLSDNNLVSEEEIKKLRETQSLLIDQRNHLYDVNKLQVLLDAKLQVANKQLGKMGEKLNTVKQGFSSTLDFISSIGIQLPGFRDALTKLDFSQVFAKLGPKISQTTFALSVGLKNAAKGGQKHFGKMLKALGVGLKSLVASIAFAIATIAFIAVAAVFALIGGLVLAAIQRGQELKRIALGVQSSANALTGQSVKFSQIYSTLGGQLGGEKAAELYNTMRNLRDVTVQTAKEVQLLQRGFAVSASQSSAMLQNMRYNYGMTEESSNKLATMVAQFAVMHKIQPTKIFEEMANLSSQVLTYFGDSPEHLVKSLFFARKLNLTIQDMASAAESLSDIENTIAKSLQVQALTGKRIDVEQILRMQYEGDTEGAVAKLVDTFGESFDKMHFTQKKAVAELVGMDVQAFSNAANSIKQTGKTAEESLQDLGTSVKKSMDESEAGLTKVATSAYGLQTPLEGVNREIQNAIYSGFKKVVDWVQDNAPRIIPVIQRISNALGQLVIKGLNWLSKPENVSKIQKFVDTLLTGFQRVLKVIPDIVSFITKFISGIYKLSGGGVMGVLAVGAAFVAITQPITTISLLLSGIKKLGILKGLGSLVGFGGLSGVGTLAKSMGSFSTKQIAAGFAGKASKDALAGAGKATMGLAKGLSAVAGLAAPVAIAIGATYGIVKVADYFSKAEVATRKYKKEIAKTLPLLDSQIRLKSLQNQKAQDEINSLQNAIQTQKDYAHRTNLTKIEQDKLADSYNTLIQAYPDLKSAADGYKLSMSGIAQATENTREKIQDLIWAQYELEKLQVKQGSINLAKTMTEDKDYKNMFRQYSLSGSYETILRDKDYKNMFRQYSLSGSYETILRWLTEGEVRSALTKMKDIKPATLNANQELLWQTLETNLEIFSMQQKFAREARNKSLRMIAPPLTDEQQKAQQKAKQEINEDLVSVRGGIYPSAEGGIATAPVGAWVAQAGQSEAIIPLSDLSHVSGVDKVLATLEKKENMSNKPINITLNIDGRKVAEILTKHTTPSTALA